MLLAKFGASLKRPNVFHALKNLVLVSMYDPDVLFRVNNASGTQSSYILELFMLISDIYSTGVL